MTGGGGLEDEAIGAAATVSFVGCCPLCPLLPVPFGLLSDTVLLPVAEEARFDAAETAAARLGGAILSKNQTTLQSLYWVLIEKIPHSIYGTAEENQPF